jgi:hypothetical protein
MTPGHTADKPHQQLLKIVEKTLLNLGFSLVIGWMIRPRTAPDSACLLIKKQGKKARLFLSPTDIR